MEWWESGWKMTFSSKVDHGRPGGKGRGGGSGDGSFGGGLMDSTKLNPARPMSRKMKSILPNLIYTSSDLCAWAPAISSKYTELYILLLAYMRILQVHLLLN
jgi:hypothetical protein